jgi:ketosteroid isomerase-like protein
MTEPRKHHIVPAFYLAGFTKTGSLTDALHVFDYGSGERYQSTPRKVCRETDFYRVEEPGEDPFLIEKLMAWHEDIVAPHVRQVGSGRASNKRQVGETLALAALLAVRSRRGRHQMEVALAAALATRLRRGEVTPEQWEHLRQAELRNGATPDQVPEYQAAKERLLNGEWFPRAPAVLVVGLIPEAQDGFMKTLLGRHWELHATDSTKNGGFISSESPLVWGDLEEIAAGRQQSLADHNIEITFPVSRNAALVSYPDAHDANCTATDEIVAHVNMRTLQLTMGLVFHARDDFLVRRRGGDIRQGSEYFAYVSRARKQGILRP